MNTESYIKSNIANQIVSLMLQKEGYDVVLFRDNNMLDRLVQVGVTKNNITKLLLSTPSFIVVDKKGNSSFVAVKFVGQGKSGRNIKWGIKQVKTFWPKCSMIIVTNNGPFFYVSDGNGLVEIDKSKFKVNKKTSKEFARLVEKFLG